MVTSEGGTGVITYDLSGVTNVDGNFEGLDAGPYTVFATDANGCEADIDATVEEPDAIVITVDATENPDNAPNGSIDVSVTGGTGDLTYAWEGPDETAYDTEDLSGLEEAGTYTLTVTDENGCSESEVVTLTDVSITEAGGALGIRSCRTLQRSGHSRAEPPGGRSHCRGLRRSRTPRLPPGGHDAVRQGPDGLLRLV